MMNKDDVKTQEIILCVSNCLSQAGYDDAAAFITRPFIKEKVKGVLTDATT